MQSGFGVNSYSVPVHLKNQGINRQNLSFGTQTQQGVQSMQGAQSTSNLAAMQNSQFISSNAQAQNPNTAQKGGSKKLLIGAVITLAGAAAIAIVCKMKGKNDKGTSKVANEAANILNNAGEKAAGGAENAAESAADAAESSKQTIFQKVKNKAKSLLNDVKKGYEEYTPKPDDSADKPSFFDEIKKGYDEYKPDSAPVKKKHKSKTDNPDDIKPVNPKSSKTIMREKIAGILSSVDSLSSSIKKASNEADELAKINISTGAGGTNGETEKWVQKIVSDFSSVQDSSIKRAGVGKKNVFIRDNADSWSYNEGYVESSKIIKAKRRIKVNADEVTVITNNVKDSKKNIETASEMLQFDKATGEIKHYDSGVEKYADGKITCTKRADFDSSGIKYYAEGYTQDSSGTFEILKTIDFRKHTGCENYKINPDGSLEIQRKIHFDTSGRPLAYLEGYKKSAAGDVAADSKIEYILGTDTPKYYYENYTFTPADSKETYTLKAEFKDGKWHKVH